MKDLPIYRHTEFFLVILFWIIMYAIIGTNYPFNFDSVNYALAIKGKFDITIQQPHPPGFFFHILFGRLLAIVMDNPFRIQQVQNLIYLTISLLCWNTSQQKKKSDLFFLASAPLVLFFTSAPVSQGAEIAFGSLLALAISKTEKKEWSPVFLTFIFFLGIGFRQNLFVLFLPVYILSLYFYKCSLKELVKIVLTAVVITLLWYLPTKYLSGGASPYVLTQNAQKVFSSSTSVFFGALPSQHLRSSLRFIIYLFSVLGPGIALYALVLKKQKFDRNLILLFAAVLPLIFYGLFVHIPLPQYYAPALGFLSAWVIIKYGIQLKRSTVVFLIIANILFFWFVPKPEFEKNSKSFLERTVSENLMKQLLYLGANSKSLLDYRRSLIAECEEKVSNCSSFYADDKVIWNRIWVYMAQNVWNNKCVSDPDSAKCIYSEE